jgi:hypothetical protein
VDWQLLSDETPVEIEVGTSDDRTAEIFAWRLDQLERAGYRHTLAVSLAEDLTIDLHSACDLLARGCADATAFLILT